LAASRQAIEDSPADGPVIGVVDRAFLTPRQIEARGDDDLTAQSPECGREVTALLVSVEEPDRQLRILDVGIVTEPRERDRRDA
jgi:hypothetical protein